MKKEIRIDKVITLANALKKEIEEMSAGDFLIFWVILHSHLLPKGQEGKGEMVVNKMSFDDFLKMDKPKPLDEALKKFENFDVKKWIKEECQPDPVEKKMVKDKPENKMVKTEPENKSLYEITPDDEELKKALVNNAIRFDDSKE